MRKDRIYPRLGHLGQTNDLLCFGILLLSLLLLLLLGLGQILVDGHQLVRFWLCIYLLLAGHVFSTSANTRDTPEMPRPV